MTGSTAGADANDNFVAAKQCNPANSYYCVTQMASNPQSDLVIIKHNTFVPTGIEDGAYSSPGNNLLIYPNPTSGSINIELKLENKQSVGVSVYSATGQLVYNVESVNPTGLYGMRIDMSAFADGKYLVRVQTGEKSFAHRFIKQ